MTKDLNKYYGVTIFHAENIAPRQWRTKAEIFRRDNFKVVETFFSEGGAMTSADIKAISVAKQKVSFFDPPSDWNE